MNRIPLDMLILDEIEKYNIKQINALRAVEANEHNDVTTTYYLLLKKILMSGVNLNSIIFICLEKIMC